MINGEKTTSKKQFLLVDVSILKRFSALKKKWKEELGVSVTYTKIIGMLIEALKDKGVKDGDLVYYLLKVKGGNEKK